jgi:hypothetical protein
MAGLHHDLVAIQDVLLEASHSLRRGADGL